MPMNPACKKVELKPLLGVSSDANKFSVSEETLVFLRNYLNEKHREFLQSQIKEKLIECVLKV